MDPNVIGEDLARALEKRGFPALTAVQEAVLDPALAGRDLRMTSQTGSGKTVAIGFVIREHVRAHAKDGPPVALVIAPTRELAKQVTDELSWLFAGMGARVASLTGGASYRDERRALAEHPAVVVGTPGRLLDYLDRGGLDGSRLGAIVLDEADRLLDMGFREDLERIFAHAPEGRATHLVSATFPREVRDLANRAQRDPVHVEGTKLGQANLDIDHVVYLVAAHDRLAALVNLLLDEPDAQTLAFARTRADVGHLAEALTRAGFEAGALSGELEQRAREKALAAFRAGELDVLVATDVAARGIDVQDIARVVHVDPPDDADSYTHRAGRTGRAGKKGTSAVLVAPSRLVPLLRMMKRAGVQHRFGTIPSPADLAAKTMVRIEQDLTGDDADDFAGFDDGTWALARRLASAPTAARTIARLVTRLRGSSGRAPMQLRIIPAPAERSEAPRERPSRARVQAEPRPHARPARERAPAPPWEREPRAPRADPASREWVTFRMTWGEEHGADRRRVLAVVCRRGGIPGSGVGAIRISRAWSTVEIAKEVAGAFAKAASRPDPRDPKVRFERMDEGHAPAPRRPGGDAPPRRIYAGKKRTP